MLRKALVFYLDAAQRVLTTRELRFASRFDLFHQVEGELDHCWSLEAWQDDDCLICAKANGAIELSCGKRQPPAEVEPGS